VVGLLTSLLGRHYTTTTAALVTGPLEAGATAFGQVGTALAVGGILGGLLAGRLQRPGIVVILALAGGTSALQAVVGLSPSLLALVLLAAPMAAAEGALATATQTMVQTIPPERLRGRVLGAWRTASTGWGLAGPLALGGLLELLGPRGGLVAGGLTSLLLLAVVGLVSKRRRPPTDTVVRPAEPAAEPLRAAA
jgi:MFS family permease